MRGGASVLERQRAPRGRQGRLKHVGWTDAMKASGFLLDDVARMALQGEICISLGEGLGEVSRKKMEGLRGLGL